MNKGNFSLIEQVDNYGFYGEIELTCCFNEENKINIIIPEKYLKWYPGVYFGAAFFVENYNTIKGLNIEVLNLKTHDVDTKNVIISYITFYAICDAMRIQPKKEPKFSKDNKAFIFPK
jgi:hypothetical protein